MNYSSQGNVSIRPPARSTRNAPREPRVSLARALSKLGHCSRSRARPLIESGAVRVNGTVCANPEIRVDMDRDRIEVDGSALAVPERVYWMINKPRGVVTTAADEKGRATVYDCLPAGLPWLGTVGRLDLESEGLLLLTNDTQWANRITDPAGRVLKMYHVQTSVVPDDDRLDHLRRGIEHRGEILAAVHVSLLRTEGAAAWIEVVLDEGKNRQIRRMLEAVGLDVVRLVRISIGSLTLGDLRPGAARALTAEEVGALARAAAGAADRSAISSISRPISPLDRPRRQK